MKLLVTMPKGLIRDSFIPPEVQEKLEQMGTIIWNTTTEQFDVKELSEKIRDVDVCITGWGCPKLDKDILENAKNLRLIAHTGGSVAGLVSDFLYEREIKVISGNEIYAESVAEGVIGYALASLRDLPFYDNEMKHGKWSQNDFYNEGLLEQTIGLVGFGMVAKNLIRLLAPFRVKVKVYSKPTDAATLANLGIELVSLDEIFTTCKIISLHVPQTPETYHMIDTRLLEMIPQGSILINTARGSVIDEQALAKQLQKGKFKAVLDVFEEEPLAENSELRQLKKTILIPHMAGPTVDRRRIVTLSLMEDILRLYKGDPLKYEISKQYAVNMTR
jgi:phosphoglycerate dehydrogenase-like enzyme